MYVLQLCLPALVTPQVIPADWEGCSGRCHPRSSSLWQLELRNVMPHELSDACADPGVAEHRSLGVHDNAHRSRAGDSRSSGSLSEYGHTALMPGGV